MIIGIYEYCGVQRCGKSTMLVADLLRIQDEHPSFPVYCNFECYIPGVKILSNDDMVDNILRIKRDKVRNVIILFDELSQVLSGRGYSNKVQTEVASFLWQMPKRGIILLYTSNIGKSVDLIIRDATWFTIMPNYKPGLTREGDWIEFFIIDNYGLRMSRGELHNIIDLQGLFDSFAPIE